MRDAGQAYRANATGAGRAVPEPRPVPRFAYRLYGVDLISDRRLAGTPGGERRAGGCGQDRDSGALVGSESEGRAGRGRVSAATSSRRPPPTIRLERAVDGEALLPPGAEVGAFDWFRHARLADGSEYAAWDGHFEFLVSSDGGLVRYQVSGETSAESLNAYLLTQSLSFALAHLGFEPLHVTVVTAGGGAVGLAGDPGAGKSTLAAAFLAAGHRLVTDDLLVLVPEGDGGGPLMAHPGQARLKLFPEVAERFLGARSRSAPMNRFTEKLVVPLAATEYQDRALPLRAIYRLESGREDAPSGPRIEPLRGLEAFQALARCCFNTVALGAPRRRSFFTEISRVAATVPIRDLRYRRRLEGIDEVVSAVLRDGLAGAR